MTKSLIAQSLLSAAFLGALTGCIVEEPRHGYVQPAAVSLAAPTVVIEDDYVYYPEYQVYFSSTRHQYLYLEGGSWVSRPKPPHVSFDVLYASPSVRLGFHDHPSAHHAEIARQYPMHSPHPGPDHGAREGHDEGKRGHD